MKTQKEPLYRKVNTKALRCTSHNKGSNYRYERNKKNPNEQMKQNVQRGLDYTPLFKFLLSRVGQDWSQTLSEAQSRLDKTEPIFHMMVDKVDGVEGYFRWGNSFYNTLYVDDNNKIQKVDPNVSVNDIKPYCDCCTHTFNGKTVTNKAQCNYDRPADDQ